MDGEELLRLRAEWHRMHEEEGNGEDADDAFGRKFGSVFAAFLAFMTLDGETRAMLRRVVGLSKSVEEAKQTAAFALRTGLSKLDARPTVG